MNQPVRRAYPSGRQDQYIVRFPDGLRERVKMQAARNRRSMNAEIVVAIEAAMQMTAGAKGLDTIPAVIDQTGALHGVNSTTAMKEPMDA